MERAEEGIAFAFKAEYEWLNTTFEGLTSEGQNAILEWPAEADELPVVARAVDYGDRWYDSEYYLYRLHVIPRLQFFVPTLEVGGPDPALLKDRRATMLYSDSKHALLQDSWRAEHHDMGERPIWTGVAAFPNIARMDSDGRPGSRIGDAGKGRIPWTGATPPMRLEAENPGACCEAR